MQNATIQFANQSFINEEHSDHLRTFEDLSSVLPHS